MKKRILPKLLHSVIIVPCRRKKITFRCRVDRESREESRDLKGGRRTEIVFVEAKRLSCRRCAIKGKEKRERESTGRDRPRAHCPIRVSLIKRSNRACYVSCMKIPLNESLGEPPKEFLRARGESLFRSLYRGKEKKKKKNKETASVFYLPQTLTHVALIRATRNR